MIDSAYPYCHAPAAVHMDPKHVFACLNSHCTDVGNNDTVTCLSEYCHGTKDCIQGAAAWDHSQGCMSGYQLTSSEFVDFNGILQV